MEAGELARRRIVWSALSELFLDTETRWYVPRIAHALAGAGYTAGELERIWQFEVVPECRWNLLQVAGEWAELPLDEPALIRRATRPPGLVRAVLARWSTALDAQFRRVIVMRDRLTRFDVARRPGVVELWSAFAHAYLERTLDDVAFLERDLARVAGAGLDRDACHASFASDFRPIYRELLSAEELRLERVRAENVAELVDRAFG
jgi:hypothetical protein